MRTNKQISTLEQGLERERLARIEAERLADQTIHDLYERQCDIQLVRSVAFAANEARSLDDVMRAALAAVCHFGGWPAGHVFFVDEQGQLVDSDLWHEDGGRFATLRERTGAIRFTRGIGLPGQVLEPGILVWIEDVGQVGDFPRARAVEELGLRAAVGVPVLVGSEVRAVLELFGEEVRPLDGRFVDVLSQVGALLGRVIEREQAQRELREANAALSKALVELQGAQGQIVQQERLSALGQMASGIAHDFNNALHPIVGYAELLLEHPAIAEAAHTSRYVQNILTSARDAAAVVSRLREFYRARDEKDSQAPVDLGMLVEQVVDLTRPRWYSEALAEGKRIQVTARVEPLAHVMAHEPQLREALINLVLNAVDAMPAGGEIELSAGMRDDRVVVAVRDTGTGMTEEVRRQCLEPFFTTKGSRGSGLGLGMVYGIVQRHEGLLEIASAPGLGTTVTLSFPATMRRAPRARITEALPPPRRILLVDDQAAARDSLRDVLEIDGHRVVTAESGVEAMAHLLNGTFDVVVTDRAMPEMNGDELAKFVKASTPTLPVVMITGFGVLMASAGERPEGVDLVLSKPVSRAALRDALRDVGAPVSSAA